jgi:hypothetical protein
MIRRIVLAAVAAIGILGSATPSIAQEKWVEYRSTVGGYRVEFPGPPKVVPMDVQTGDGPKHLELPQMKFGDQSFIAAYADLSGDPDPQEFLERSRSGSVANSKGTLRSSQRLMVGGAPARRFIYEKPDKSVVVHLTVVSGRRVFQLECIGPADQVDSAVVKHFIDSFALVAR